MTKQYLILHPRQRLFSGALSRRICHVWWTTAVSPNMGIRSVLSREELDRLDRFQNDDARDSFATGRYLLRSLLAWYLHESPKTIVISCRCDFCEENHGKPRLAPQYSPFIHFSVTHSGARVMIAFAVGTPIGVDVERVSEELAVNELASACLTEAEMSFMQRAPAPARSRVFFAYWTMKEAIVKAAGMGLRYPLTDLCIPSIEDEDLLIDVPEGLPIQGPIGVYRLRCDDEHIASLAVPGGSDTIFIIDGAELLEKP